MTKIFRTIQIEWFGLILIIKYKTMVFLDRDEPIEEYKTYKARIYEKRKQKIRLLLNSIDETSLRPKDKSKLLIQIKLIVAEY